VVDGFMWSLGFYGLFLGCYVVVVRVLWVVARVLCRRYGAVDG